MIEEGKHNSVLVVGGGIAGIEAALQLADCGYQVILVEESPSLGGRLSQLDKTFPSNDCAMCNLAPRMVEVASHTNIRLLTYSEIIAARDQPGYVRVTVRQKARSIDEAKCTGCGECVLHCPVRYSSYYPLLELPDPEMAQDEMEHLDRIINSHIHDRAPLIPVLQAINDRLGHLPESVLYHLSRRLGIPLAHILRVATYYPLFSLKPRGRYLISVCRGISCFAAGADRILERFQEILDIEVGGTTPDRQFSLEVVRCLGCCSLAPTIKIDDQVHSGVRPQDVEYLIESCLNEE